MEVKKKRNKYIRFHLLRILIENQASWIFVSAVSHDMEAINKLGYLIIYWYDGNKSVDNYDFTNYRLNRSYAISTNDRLDY